MKNYKSLFHIKANLMAAILLLFAINNNISAQWIKTNTNTKENIYDILFVDSITAFSVGSNGVILKSIDRGDNWNLIYSDSSLNLSKLIYFQNELQCYGNSNNTKIRLTTNDNGQNWSLDTVNFYPRNAIVYNDSLYYLELDSSLIRVDPNGNQKILLADSARFFDVNKGGLITYFNVGCDIILLKSNDYGKQWARLNFERPSVLTPNSYNYASFRFFGDSILLKITYPSAVIYSFDGGANWSFKTHENSAAFQSIILSPEVLYGIGNKDEIVFTYNTGAFWTIQDTLTDLRYNGVNKLYFVDQMTGFICGDSGTILKTSNGGAVGVGMQEQNELKKT